MLVQRVDHGSEAHCSICMKRLESAAQVHVNTCLIPGLSQVYNPFNVTSTHLKQEIKMRSFKSKEVSIPTIIGILTRIKHTL